LRRNFGKAWGNSSTWKICQAPAADHFAEWIRAEIAKWRKVIRDGNISVQ
jgi:hypothetical protein